MIINYCSPQSTSYANSELQKIFRLALEAKKGLDIRLSDGKLNREGINITYGYLGLYCNAYFSNIIKQYPDIFNRSFAIDHSYTPKNLKGKIFRISKMNTVLETQIFNESMISCEDKDIIHSYFKELSEGQNINVMVPTIQAKQVHANETENKKIILLIKHSSLQERIKRSAQPLISIAKNKTKGDDNNKLLCIAYKPWEVKVNRYGRHKIKDHVGKRINISTDRIDVALCHSSMMAIELILKGCPVKLSDGHPLYRLIGSYVPKQTIKERIHMAMSCVEKISFSTNKINDAGLYLSEMCY